MRTSRKPQSTTSIRRAPRDEATSRSTRYLVTMGVRIACFILMVAITPYGWYTWVFGAGAVLLPYFAVVMANVGSDTAAVVAVNPERALTATVPPPVATAPESPSVFRIEETRRIDPPGRTPTV